MKSKCLKFLFVLLLGCVALWSCSDDEDSPLKGIGNMISSFTLTTDGGVKYTGYVSDTLIEVAIPLNVSLKNAKVNYSLSELAQIAPDPAGIINWMDRMEFTVTSYNQTPRKYVFKVKYTDVASEGDVLLNTQADVDAFVLLKNSVISGNLVIGSDNEEEAPVTDLSGLTFITEVKGEVIVKPSFAGTSLKGLDNLKATMGFSVNGNTQNEFDVEFPNLKNLGGLNVDSEMVNSLCFPKVTGIGVFNVKAAYAVKLDFSSLVQAFNGIRIEYSGFEAIEFPALEEVTGNLYLWKDNEATVVHFPNLKVVNGDLEISFANKMQSVDLSKLEDIRRFKITYCPELKECILPELKSSGSFDVDWNKTIKTISASQLESTTKQHFNGMVWVVGGFSVGGEALETIDFPALKSTGGITVHGTSYSETGTLVINEVSFPALEETTGLTISKLTVNKLLLPSLKRLPSRFSLQNVKNLKSVDLSNVEGITEFYCFDCPELEEIKSPKSIGKLYHGWNKAYLYVKYVGLEEVTVKMDIQTGLEGQLSFPGIKKVNSLIIRSQNYTAAPITVEMPDLQELGKVVESHSGLTQFSAKALTTVTGDFEFVQLYVFTGFELPNLKTIGGALTLSSYSGKATPLTNLNDLSSLQSVGGKVTIDYLTNLVDFSGLKNIVGQMIDGNWVVTNCAYNPDLSDMQNGNYTQK